MRPIKVKPVPSVVILTLSFLLLFSAGLDAARQYAVQVAASKGPLDVQDFAKKHGITENISEIKSEDWYRYVIGNFDDLRSASRYASEVSQTKGIPGAFPRKLDAISADSTQSANVNSAGQTSLPEDTAVSVEPSVAISPKPIARNGPEPEISGETEETHGIVNSFILWISGDQNVSELKENLDRFGEKNVPLFLQKFYARLIEKTYTYPVILIFIVVILFFMANVMLVLLVLYYSNKQKNHKDRYIRVYRNLYEDILRSYLFGEIDWEKALLKFKKLNKPLNRRILTSVLLTFKENLRGEMDSQISAIFVNLGLQKDSLKSAESSFYFSKVQGIRELTNLNPENAKTMVPNYLNDPHDLVRTESQVSYIRLNPEKPFEFLRTLTSPFSRWTQLSAFYLLRLHQLPVPAFVDYLQSELPTVRNFCLRMIIFFQQLENATEIFKMLESPSEITRFLSIRAINDLRLYDGKQLIRDLYPMESEKNRIEIIRALKNIGSEDDFDILESIIRTGSVTLRTEACRSLYFMNEEGRARLIFLSRNTDLNIERYLAHITDPRN